MLSGSEGQQPQRAAEAERLEFESDGFLKFEGVVPERIHDAIQGAVVQIFTAHFKGHEPRGADGILFRSADHWRRFKPIRELATAPRLSAFLASLMDANEVMFIEDEVTLFAMQDAATRQCRQDSGAARYAGAPWLTAIVPVVGERHAPIDIDILAGSHEWQGREPDCRHGGRIEDCALERVSLYPGDFLITHPYTYHCHALREEQRMCGVLRLRFTAPGLVDMDSGGRIRPPDHPRVWPI